MRHDTKLRKLEQELQVCKPADFDRIFMAIQERKEYLRLHPAPMVASKPREQPQEPAPVGSRSKDLLILRDGIREFFSFAQGPQHRLLLEYAKLFASAAKQDAIEARASGATRERPETDRAIMRWFDAYVCCVAANPHNGFFLSRFCTKLAEKLPPDSAFRHTWHEIIPEVYPVEVADLDHRDAALGFRVSRDTVSEVWNFVPHDSPHRQAYVEALAMEPPGALRELIALLKLVGNQANEARDPILVGGYMRATQTAYKAQASIRSTEHESITANDLQDLQAYLCELFARDLDDLEPWRDELVEQLDGAIVQAATLNQYLPDADSWLGDSQKRSDLVALFKRLLYRVTEDAEKWHPACLRLLSKFSEIVGRVLSEGLTREQILDEYVDGGAELYPLPTCAA